MSQPYALQEQINSEGVLTETTFNNVNITLPLSKIQHLIPNLLNILKKLEDTPQILYTNIEEFQNPSSTYIRVKVAGVSSLAVLDTGAPLVILSSHFAKQLRLDPDVEYNKVFGTAGEKNTQALGAYLSIPIKIGNITTFSPAIILNASGYNILCWIKLLREVWNYHQ